MSVAKLTTADVSGVRSMTGQGRASGKTDLGNVAVELRTVNNRGFKCSVRTPETLSRYDLMVEAVIRQSLHRGSVNVSLSIERDQGQTPVQINEPVLAGYIRQCQSAIGQSVSAADSNVVLNVAALTSLPGVLSSESLQGEQADAVWQQVKVVLIEAVENLVVMRGREGAHMAETLLADCAIIRDHVHSVQELAPQAAENYRTRLETKVRRVLEDYDAEVHAVDLLREVQLYADKADVSEEITRMDSHLSLFESVLRGENREGGKNRSAAKESGRDEPIGRKLDFVIQEMFRETNTIGSKSAHSGVSALVVEIKCAIERMRELVQNLE